MQTQKQSTHSPSNHDNTAAAKQRPARPLSDRDHELLVLVSEQRAIRLDQLARFLGQRPSEVRRIVDRLERDGYACQRRFLVDEPDPWVWLTKRGLRVSGTGYFYHVPGVGALAHTAAVNEVRLAIARCHPGARWVSERALSREDGRCRHHLADGAFELAGARHAIEVELSHKWPERVAQIVAELSERYDGVEYYCTPATRRIVERAQREHGFAKLGIHDLATVGS